MRRNLILGLLIGCALGVAGPAEAGFRSLSREIGMSRDFNRVTIPFFGVARFAVWMVKPDGIHDVKLAVFESRGRGGSSVDLGTMMQRHARRGWSPMIRTSSRGGEETHIFVQERGENIALLIAAKDRGEVVVIELVLNPERFAAVLDEGGDFVSIGRGSR
jgi:hypothetical protein